MLGGRGVSAGHPCSAHALPRLLRYAAKRLYELCLGVVLCLTKPAFMRRPWRITPCPAVHGWAFLCFMGIILQYLNSFAMRSHENPCAPARRGLRPLRCGGNPPRRASLVILLGVNSNCPNSGECIALQQGLKNKQMFAIINEARK